MSADLWDQILARVEGKINRHSFATWFRPTTYVDLDSQRLRVAVPNAQFREWLTKNYQGVLAEALSEVGHPDIAVEFEEHADSQLRVRRPVVGVDEQARAQSMLAFVQHRLRHSRGRGRRCGCGGAREQRAAAEDEERDRVVARTTARAIPVRGCARPIAGRRAVVRIHASFFGCSRSTVCDARSHVRKDSRADAHAEGRAVAKRVQSSEPDTQSIRNRSAEPANVRHNLVS